MKKVILTGDRPTGKLHLGHFVGSLKNRVELQNSGEFDTFIMIADMQALTDNARNPAKVRENMLEVALDYLAVGIDPAKSTIFIQSQIPALSELTMYYMNLVSLSRVLRNPTVKSEIAQKDFGEGENAGVPAGFAMYPISQAADITAFNANLVPVGVDQLPMIEQTREIVRSFNQTYGETLVEPDAYMSSVHQKHCLPGYNDNLAKKYAERLPGIDFNAKMSKSLNNAIYLSDSEEALYKKVMSAYTDPNHIHVEDPGNPKNNIPFIYLDVFADMLDHRNNPDLEEGDFHKYQSKFIEMLEQYKKGGLGDVAVKKYLFEVLNEFLKPIRKKRENLAKDPAKIYEILREGSEKANIVANETLQKVRNAIGINYFEK